MGLIGKHENTHAVFMFTRRGDDRDEGVQFMDGNKNWRRWIQRSHPSSGVSTEVTVLWDGKAMPSFTCLTLSWVTSIGPK